MSSKAALAVTGVCVCFSLWLLVSSIIVMGLYAASRDGVDIKCEVAIPTLKATVRERTAGMGIFAAVVSIILAAISIPMFIFLRYTSPTIILICSIVYATLAMLISLFFLIAMALIGKDIDDVPSSCNTPGPWGAALAFALFGMINWFLAGVGVFVWYWVETKGNTQGFQQI